MASRRLNQRVGLSYLVMISPADVIATVPSGAWAVGVSGGADSVAMLCLLRTRSDLSLHVVHLNHQLRGQASTEDAEFVRQLCEKFALTGTVARCDQIEPTMATLPHNPSAKYRAMRMEVFRRVVRAKNLQGVLLAHHADDQAETILHRLLRGSATGGLRGMSPITRVASLLIVRPLLEVTREQLRQYLASVGQQWREDASNESDRYLRNRLRRWLKAEPELPRALIELGKSCRELSEWTQSVAPGFSREFRTGQLQRQPRVLAREAARRWLIAEGAKPDELDEEVLDRLIEMASDAASASRQMFPGGLTVVRRAGLMMPFVGDTEAVKHV